MFSSRRENDWYRTGRYPITRARNPNPTPASITVTARPARDIGVTSPRPRVKNVSPLRYRWSRKAPSPSTFSRVPIPACTIAKAVTRLAAQAASSTSNESGP